MIFRRPKEHAAPAGYADVRPVPGGGAAAVFLAVQAGLGRPVLLYAAPQGLDFERLRWTLAHLPEHPGIAAIYDAGRAPDGRPYVATAVTGGSLVDRLGAEGPLPPTVAVPLAAHLADALAAAHAAGVVHGDVRPEYAWGAGEQVRLGGFGLLSPAAPPLSWDPRSLVHFAPEVLEGGEPTPAADVYAVASVLHTLLTGEPAHLAAAWAGLATLIHRKLEQAPPLSGAVPDETAAVIRRCMSPDPAARGSAADLAAALLRGVPAEPQAPARSEGRAVSGEMPGPVREHGSAVNGAAPTPPPGQETEPAGGPPAPPEPPAAVPGLDVETAPARGGGQRVLVVAAAALVIVAVTGLAGAVGRRHDDTAAPRSESRPASATTPVPSPTVTRQAAPLTKLELTRYQPMSLKATPAPQQAVLTWRLPPDARRDGAGIIIRRQPADDSVPFTALSRTDGRLPETYVAVPLKPGQQYCFLVGVLLERTGGGTTLAQSGPVCALPR